MLLSVWAKITVAKSDGPIGRRPPDPITDHCFLVTRSSGYSIYFYVIGTPLTLSKTENYMTTEEEFRKYTTKTLEQLDATLPEGSYVVHTGLADGRVLWDMMHDRLHPLGEYGKDITFQVCEFEEI